MPNCFGTEKQLRLLNCRVQAFAYNEVEDHENQIFDAPLNAVSIVASADRQQVQFTYQNQTFTIEYDFGSWTFSDAEGTFEPEDFETLIEWIESYRSVCAGVSFTTEVAGFAQTVTVAPGDETVTFAGNCQWFQIFNTSNSHVLEVQIGTGTNSILHQIAPNSNIIIDYGSFGFITVPTYSEIRLVNSNGSNIVAVVNARAISRV